MRKKSLSYMLLKGAAVLMLALCICISPLIPALSGTDRAYAAGGAFTDITDKDTAVAAEILRVMGMVEGNGNGKFSPNGTFTRAQFCKMAIHMMLQEGNIGKYSTITIFPDVTPNHWAYKYINYASKTDPRIISGYPSGVFKPDQAIKADEAATILLRILGYDDSSLIWPMGVMDKAEEIGLLDGTGIKRTDAENSITRSQAARLFTRALSTPAEGGGTLYTIGEKVTLLSIDGGKGTMNFSDGSSAKLYTDITSSSLVGSQGRLVTNGTKALTFIPESTVTAGIGGAAVIVSKDGSTAGLSALAGSGSYKIYKNGLAATAADLKKYDVCIYSSATNSIIVCDTRVSVVYEDCTPSPSAPTAIYCLGGQKFELLDSAAASVAQYKLGESFTILLTADGQIAGVTKDVKGNAIGLNASKLEMFIGPESIELDQTKADIPAARAENYANRVVAISQYRSGEISLSLLSTGVTGDLRPAENKAGDTTITENARFFDYGMPVAKDKLASVVRESDLSYVHTNWAGKADVVQLHTGNKETLYYGRARVDTDDSGSKNVSIDCGYAVTPYIESSYSFQSGKYYFVRLNSQGTFAFIDDMAKISNVGKSNWIGTSAVTFGANTYEVPSDVMCYVPSSGRWMDLDSALAYTDTFNMYIYSGVVRCLEVAE